MLSRFSHVWHFGTPWTVACQVPLSMQFSSQEYWSGLSCPPPGISLTQGSNCIPLWLLHYKWILYSWATREAPSILLTAPHSAGKRESEVAQSCPTLCHPVDCSWPGSIVHGIFQARILEWVFISFYRRSPRPRDQTQVSCIVDRRFTVCHQEILWYPVAEINTWVVAVTKVCLWVCNLQGFSGGSVVKNAPAMQETSETSLRSLDQEEPLEKEMATRSSILAWRIPWTEKPGGPQSIGLQRVRHDWASNIHCYLWASKTLTRP